MLVLFYLLVGLSGFFVFLGHFKIRFRLFFGCGFDDFIYLFAENNPGYFVLIPQVVGNVDVDILMRADKLVHLHFNSNKYIIIIS